MKKSIIVLLAIVLCLSVLAGCGGSGLSGKYNLKTIEGGGMSMDAEGLAALGMGEMYIEFLSDGNCNLSVIGETTAGTYKVNGNSVDITVEGETQTASVSGNTITLEIEGSKAVFEK